MAKQKQTAEEIKQELLENKKIRLKDLQFLCALFGINSHVNCRIRYQLCDMLSLYAVSHPTLWARHKNCKAP